MLKLTIYYVLIYFLVLVYATDSIENCDKEDLECLEAFTTTSDSTNNSITPSSSYISSFATDEALNSIVFDVHQAKVSEKYKKEQVNAIKDDPDATEESSDLNNVQTGVLTACGVLVVGGIAVGIFVWKSTNEKQTSEHPDDVAYEKTKEQRTMQQVSIDMPEFSTGSNLLKEPTIISDPNSNRLATDMPSSSQPAALDPVYSPSAITYPLRKFLNSPVLAQSSAMQIPLKREVEKQ